MTASMEELSMTNFPLRITTLPAEFLLPAIALEAMVLP